MKRDLIAAIAAGVFVSSVLLSAGLTDSAKAADDGPDVPHFLYDESSVVKGTGDISIRGSFSDHALDSSGWMKGRGSMNFESLRSMNKICQKASFNQKTDLVFAGQLKDRKSLASPLFDRGIGASVSEWFNLSHVDKSETDTIRSVNRFNNTLNYNTDLAYEGTWDIKSQQGSLFHIKKSEQQYSGSFQTRKDISFTDSGKNEPWRTKIWRW